jgi:hypothetical protein
MLASGWFTSVCSLNVNVLEHCVCCMFTGGQEDGTESVPKCWHLNYRCR